MPSLDKCFGAGPGLGAREQNPAHPFLRKRDLSLAGPASGTQARLGQGQRNLLPRVGWPVMWEIMSTPLRFPPQGLKPIFKKIKTMFRAMSGSLQKSRGRNRDSPMPSALTHAQPLPLLMSTAEWLMCYNQQTYTDPPSKPVVYIRVHLRCCTSKDWSLRSLRGRCPPWGFKEGVRVPQGGGLPFGERSTRSITQLPGHRLTSFRDL